MIFRRFILAWLSLNAACMAWAANPIPATITNNAEQAEIEGRQLAQKLGGLQPAQGFTNTATLKIHGKGRRADISFQISTVVTDTNWQASYVADTTNDIHSFFVVHAPELPNEYHIEPCNGNDRDRLMSPFAGSDFWVVDLGADFFHWPTQMLWKREMKNGQACDVLESRPSSVATNGYSRVVSWIDQDTGGIVQAEAYDAKGKWLKEFEVKEARKVNGEWRVSELEMRNVQTHSSTLLLFNFEK